MTENEIGTDFQCTLAHTGGTLAGEIFVYSNFRVLPPTRAGPWAGLTFMLGEYSRRCGREIFSKIYLYFLAVLPPSRAGLFGGLGGSVGGSSREVPLRMKRSMNTPTSDATIRAFFHFFSYLKFRQKYYFYNAFIPFNCFRFFYENVFIFTLFVFSEFLCIFGWCYTNLYAFEWS